MWRFRLLVVVGVALVVGNLVYAMENQSNENLSSPRQFHSIWFLNDAYDHIAKIDFPQICVQDMGSKRVKKIDIQGIADVLSEKSIDVLIAFTEHAGGFNPLEGNDFNVVPLAPCEDDFLDYAQNFCGLINTYTGKNIALYGAGNNEDVYVMLACLFIDTYIRSNIIKGDCYTIYQEQPVTLMQAICINAPALKDLMAKEIVDLAYKATIPDVDYISQKNQDCITLFCTKKLMLPSSLVRRRGSSCSRLSIGGKKNSKEGQKK